MPFPSTTASRSYSGRWAPLWGALSIALSGCGEDIPRPTEAASVGPIALPPGQEIGGPARALGKEDGPRFSGVAAVNLNGLPCSGSLVVPSTTDLTVDGPAYLLTAGHCLLGLGDPNDVVLDQNLEQPDNRVRFRYFGDSSDGSTEVRPKRIVFATLKGVDLGIVELVPSRLVLRAVGVVPFVLSDTLTAADEPIAFAGHPHMSPALLGACALGWRVPFLLEFPYHWYGVEANTCQGIAPGASGAPVFSLATGKVTAVVNTKAEPGTVPCALGSPCEGGASSLRFVDGTNYAIPVANLAACFDVAGKFDLGGTGCPLDRGNQMLPAHSSVTAASAPGQTIGLQEPLMNRGLTHYRYAIGPAATNDCLDASRYGPIVAWSDAPSIAETLPGDPAIHLVCIQAGPGPDPTEPGWQDPAKPTVLPVLVYAP